MSFFHAENISAGYGKKKILQDVTFTLSSGCILGVLGANGCGKTTLLKSLCGILPHKGNCLLDGVILEDLPTKQIASMCSYVPQRSGISIEMSVLDVVLMGFNPRLHLLDHPSENMRREALDAIARVGLSGKEYDDFLSLSEGQKQLCILARTFVSQSRLFLLDEPESALDFRFRYRMLELLRSEMKTRGASAIVTLHDISLALNYCDQLLLLSNGHILGMLSPEKDSLSAMQKMLSVIYGEITLARCTDRKGKTHIIMLKEDEE